MSAFDPAAVAVGDELPPLDLRATRAAAVRYAGASTDFNPIHWSDRMARGLGLDGVIIHGMWTMGAALRIVTDWCIDPSRLVDYSVRFTGPVPLSDDDEGTLVRVTATSPSRCSVPHAPASGSRGPHEHRMGGGRRIPGRTGR